MKLSRFKKRKNWQTDGIEPPLERTTIVRVILASGKYILNSPWFLIATQKNFSQIYKQRHTVDVILYIN